MTDNLSKTLQHQSMSAAQSQDIVKLTIETLKSLEQTRHKTTFQLFFELPEHLCNHTEAEEPSLPRKRKAPKWFEVGDQDHYHSPIIQEHYCQQCFEAVDLGTCISRTQDVFNQSGYAIYQTIKALLLTAVNNKEYSAEPLEDTVFYGDDFISFTKEGQPLLCRKLLSFYEVSLRINKFSSSKCAFLPVWFLSYLQQVQQAKGRFPPGGG